MRPATNIVIPSTCGTVAIGDLPLELGGVLSNAYVGYQTWGTLNKQGTNVIVLPSYYSGTTESYEPWVGEEGLFDPNKYFVIAYDQLGAGASSKPSTCAGLAAWKVCTAADSVTAARKMLVELGVTHVRLVCGWSMGGMQAFSWNHLFPDFIDAAFALCATPEASAVNRVFLESVRSCLTAGNGSELRELSEAEVKRRLRSFGRVYAGWAYSNEFFLEQIYTEVGYESLEGVLSGWAEDHASMNAEDLVAQLDCWLHTRTTPAAHIANTEPLMIAAPCSTDRYFLPETLHAARADYPNLRVHTLTSPLGHIAGRPGIRRAETERIRIAVNIALGAREGP